MIVRLLGVSSLLVGLALAGCQTADPLSAPGARDVSAETVAAVDAAPGAHQPFDVSRRRAAGEVEQPRFGVRRGDPCDSADL